MAEWRKVPSFPGYEAHRDGSVRSVRTLKSGMVRKRIVQGAVFSPHPKRAHPVFYRLMCLSVRGQDGVIRQISAYRHKMVGEAFLGLPKPGYVIGFKDGDGLNCAVSNLEHITHAERQLRAMELRAAIENEA